DWSLADPLELDAVARLEGTRQGDEVFRVHLHRVRMARVAYHLVARPGDLAVHRAGPVPPGGRADHDHRTAIRWIPGLHGPERADDLVVVVTIRQRQHVPPVRGPLVDQAIARELAGHHAADQRIVDSGVVVGQEDPEPLADLQRDGLGLE